MEQPAAKTVAVTASASWTVTQPWRGLFGVVVTLWVALLITASFGIEQYLGAFTLFIMSLVAIEVVMGLGWGGKYPDTEGWTQPRVGMFLMLFMGLLGTLAYLTVLHVLSAGVPQPYTNVYSIVTVITMFFLVIAFGMWPFHNMSLPAKGLLTWVLGYVIAFFVLKLFNFSLLSYPTGVSPSPIPAVPFYAAGGPLAPFAGLAPAGPFAWETAIAFYFWMVLFLFVFVMLGMWPFYKFPTLMKQPALGITLAIACAVLAYIAHLIGIVALGIEPLKWLLTGVCYLFGILVFLTMFQMWPGRVLKPPALGFLNLALAIAVGIIAYYGIGAFCAARFGKAFAYPNNIFSMANVMLGLTFPAWAAYTAFWDFWPLPPTPSPPQQ